MDFLPHNNFRKDVDFLTIQQLKYAVTAAEKGTMSEAAQSLFLSQPSLTAAIKELEKELRITIFHRTNKGVIATNEGEEFLGYARQVLQQVGLIEEKYLEGKQLKQIFSVSASTIHSLSMLSWMSFKHSAIKAMILRCEKHRRLKLFRMFPD